MKKEAIISILGIQKYEGQAPDNIELVTNGFFHIKDGKFYVQYDETELTGMEGTKTMIKIEPQRVAIMRSGSTTAQLTFTPGDSNAALYNTMYGPIDISTKTRSLECALDENGGSVDIKYDVEIDRTFASLNTLKIVVKIA